MKQNLITKFGNYQFTGKSLGKGHFGFVELAIHTITNVQVAVKIIEVGSERASNTGRNSFREVSMLKKLNHPGIVKMYETMRTKNICCLVMEYVDGGNLLNYLREKPGERLGEEEATIYFKQIASVLDHLHKRRIVHRDLKMENILLQGPTREVVKVIDFALSNTFSKEKLLTTKYSSPEYSAPELFKKDCEYGTEVDIWSLGIILYRMLVGQFPFRNENYGKLVCLIAKGLTNSHHMKMTHLSAECTVLLSNILQPDPARRYLIENVMSHSWTSHDASTLTTFRAPMIDPRMKQKVITATANLMKVSKTEVNQSVDLRKCDSVFAVYSMLLKEEIQYNKTAAKRIIPLNIQAHDSSSLLTGKRTVKKEASGNETWTHSGGGANIRHKRRLCSGPGRGTLNRGQVSEKKSVNESSAVVGKRIESDLLRQAFIEEITNENKTKNDIEELSDDIKVSESNESLEMKKNISFSKNITMDEDPHEDSCNKEKKTPESQDIVSNGDANNWSSYQQFCKECYRLFNNGKSNSSIPGGGAERMPEDNTCTPEHLEIEIHLPTMTDGENSSCESNVPTISPSRNQHSHGKYVSTEESNHDLTQTHEEVYEKEKDQKSEDWGRGVTCVTLQVLDMKKKKSITKRRPTQQKKYTCHKGQGSKLSTIPSKRTVNPTRDVEEAIEERLKACLKNSAASLRQRPHTASAKISGRSIRVKSGKVNIPARPATAVSFAQASEKQKQDWQGKQRKKSKTEATNCHCGNKASRNNDSPQSKYHYDFSEKDSEKSCVVKKASWFGDKQGALEISGKKLSIASISNNESVTRKYDGRVKSKIHENKLVPENSENSLCSIVSTGRFKNSTETKNFEKTAELENAESSSRAKGANESTGHNKPVISDSNFVKTGMVEAWLSKLKSESQKLEPHAVEKPALQKRVPTVHKYTYTSRNSKTYKNSEHSENAKNSEKFENSKNQPNNCPNSTDEDSHQNEANITISRKNPPKKFSRKPRNSIGKSDMDKATTAKKWRALETLLSNENEPNSEIQDEVKREPECESKPSNSSQAISETSSHVFVPTVSSEASSPLMVPQPSVNVLDVDEDDENGT